MDDDSFPYLALDRKVPTAIFSKLTQAGAVDSFEIDEEYGDDRAGRIWHVADEAKATAILQAEGYLVIGSQQTEEEREKRQQETQAKRDAEEAESQRISAEDDKAIKMAWETVKAKVAELKLLECNFNVAEEFEGEEKEIIATYKARDAVAEYVTANLTTTGAIKVSYGNWDNWRHGLYLPTELYDKALKAAIAETVKEPDAFFVQQVLGLGDFTSCYNCGHYGAILADEGLKKQVIENFLSNMMVKIDSGEKTYFCNSEDKILEKLGKDWRQLESLMKQKSQERRQKEKVEKENEA